MTRHIVQRQTPVGALIAPVVAAAATASPAVAASPPPAAESAEEHSSRGAGANQLRTEEQE